METYCVEKSNTVDPLVNVPEHGPGSGSGPGPDKAAAPQRGAAATDGHGPDLNPGPDPDPGPCSGTLILGSMVHF